MYAICIAWMWCNFNKYVFTYWKFLSDGSLDKNIFYVRSDKTVRDPNFRKNKIIDVLQEKMTEKLGSNKIYKRIKLATCNLYSSLIYNILNKVVEILKLKRKRKLSGLWNLSVILTLKKLCWILQDYSLYIKN